MMIILTMAKAKTNRAVETENQISNLRFKLSLISEVIKYKITSDFLLYVTEEIICRTSNVSFLKLTLIITPGSLNFKPEHSGNTLCLKDSFFFHTLSYDLGLEV